MGDDSTIGFSPSCAGEGHRRPSVRHGFRSMALTVLVLVGLFGCAVSGPLRPTDFQDMVQDVEKKAQFVRQFRADFTKTRHTPVFNRDMTVKGSLIFQRPNKFLVTLTGDVNAELVSDGTTIHIVHDNKDQEVFQVQGERDQTRFADPLMLLINSIGQGGLRKFHPVHTESGDKLMTMEFRPHNETNFERIQSVTVQLSEDGQIRKVTIISDDGESEEVVFDSWRMLAQDDPDVVKLDEKLRALSASASGGAEPSDPHAVKLVRSSQRVKGESPLETH